MNALFMKVLDASFAAGCLVLALVPLRYLLKKAPKWLICSLWALVALRLLMPSLPESRFGLIPEAQMTEVLETALPTAPAAEELPAPLPAAPIAPKKTPLRAGTPWAALWLAGVVGMLGWGLWNDLRIRRKISASLEVRPGVRICDYIDTPFVLGLLRPKICLPSDLDPKDAAYVLAHEQAHLRRGDPLWKALGFLLLAVHWFNPLLWLAYGLFSRDVEAACDERVIRDYSQEEKARYSEALLRCSLPKHMLSLLAFGEIGVKQRVKNIMHYRKPALWIVAAALLVMGITGLCFLTSPSGPSLSALAGDYESASIWTSRGIFPMDRPEQAEAMKAFLKNTRYDPKPVPGGMELHRGWQLFLTKTRDPLDSYLYISGDCKTLSCVRQEEVTASYSLENPGEVREFLDYWSGVVIAQKSDRASYWSKDRPWVWAEAVTLDDIAAAFYPNTPQNSEYFVFRRKLQPVVDSLNRLDASDFTPAEPVEKPLLNLTYPANSENKGLYLYDTVNGLVEVLHLSQGRLELLVTEELESVMASERNQVPWSRWEIRSPELAEALDRILDGIEKNTRFGGWRFNLKHTEYAHGDIRISAEIPEDWVTETVPYTDAQTPCGIRCRPPEAQEGWMFFGFWPDGTQPELVYRQWQEETPGGTYYTSFDSSQPWIRRHTQAIGDINALYDRAAILVTP